jgi:hypothetical protein
MARNDLDTNLGFVDKRRTGPGGVTATPTGTDANYSDVAALRARLAAINAGLYTAAYLDLMTKNDMVYAVRLADDPTGV